MVATVNVGHFRLASQREAHPSVGKSIDVQGQLSLVEELDAEGSGLDAACSITLRNRG